MNTRDDAIADGLAGLLGFLNDEDLEQKAWDAFVDGFGDHLKQNGFTEHMVEESTDELANAVASAMERLTATTH